jgi:hypothetical protein
MNSKITESPTDKDGFQNLSAAYNLAYYGVISGRHRGDVFDSRSPESDLSPTDYREPLPIFFLAAYIKLHPLLSSGLTVDTINEGSAVIAVKQHNLIWASFCLLGVALTIMLSIRSPLLGVVVAVIAMALTYRLFLVDSLIIDRTYTEVQASALLVWSSITLITALKTGRPIWFIATGILAGALALTKGIFLYVGIGLIVTLLLIYLVHQPRWGRWGTVSRIGLIAIALMAVTIPWMVRNFLYFGAFEITQRGGTVLLIRAYKNQMSDEEYKGAFYYYAPPYLKVWLGERLGFTPEDFEKGGRLQRLNRDQSSFADHDVAAEIAGRPEDAISFYRSARAEWYRLAEYYRDEGAINPSHLAERDAHREAKQLIFDDPVQHLKMSAVFMWRGMWTLSGVRGANPAISFYINVFGFLAICIMALLGLLRRDAAMLGIALLPVGAIIFLALFSHFLPRYLTITIPNMIIALSLLTVWIASWLGSLIWQKFHFPVIRRRLHDGIQRPLISSDARASGNRTR